MGAGFQQPGEQRFQFGAAEWLVSGRSLIVGTSSYNFPGYMGLLADLLTWSAGDPPDGEEIAREDVIFAFQGNRNPFIDHPE